MEDDVNWQTLAMVDACYIFTEVSQGEGFDERHPYLHSTSLEKRKKGDDPAFNRAAVRDLIRSRLELETFSVLD